MTGTDKAQAITLYHNPACGTSRNVLRAIRDAGHEPRVVEYLEVGWRREELETLLERMGAAPRDVLRVRGTPAEDLGLTAASATDGQILVAMTRHPVLVERPIVVGPRGVALCRPVEKVLDII